VRGDAPRQLERAIEWLTLNAMRSAFAPFDERLRLINTVIKPGFAAARALSNAQVPPHLL
jgi:hypothetical protein